MTEHPDKIETDRINQIITGYADRLDELATDLAIESAGVAQAVDALRRALDKVEQCQEKRQYEEVANLGYSDVSSEFIFLQRTMGSLHAKALQRSSIISEIARDAKTSWERVEPLVNKWLNSNR